MPGQTKLITNGKQVYEVTDETLEHETRDGRTTILRRVVSHCAWCGELFDFWAVEETLEHHWINRRCRAHKKPGIEVRHHRLGSPEDQEVWFGLGR